MKQNKKKIIGLTGTIAAGKSTVAAYLREQHGVPTLDADEVNREVLDVQQVKDTLVGHFGLGIIDRNGKINRPALAYLVFQDEKEKDYLTSVTWPVIVAAITAWIEKTEGELLIVEAIDLLKTTLPGGMDEIWVVTAPEEERLRRLKENRGMTEEEARARIASQWSDEEYIERATRVIDSGCEMKVFLRRIERAYRRARRSR